MTMFGIAGQIFDVSTEYRFYTLRGQCHGWSDITARRLFSHEKATLIKCWKQDAKVNATLMDDQVRGP